MTVDQFEAFCQAQRPAEAPWRPVTDYSHAARDRVERPHAERILTHLVTSPWTSVLDYGCGPDQHLLRNLRALEPSPLLRLTGYDPQLADTSEAVHFLYDLVICREVLEHLTVLDLAHTVAHLCRLSRRLVYVTTRFAPFSDDLLDVATADDLDPTHITMLNQDFLRLLFVLQGLTRRRDLEQALDWQHQGRVLIYGR